MATEYLDKGAKTFAASAWSGSGIADSNDFIVDQAFGPISAGLDQSGLTTGIESLQFVGSADGTVGGGSYGPLLIDVDNSSDAKVVVRPAGGQVVLYISAAGGSGVINNLDIGPGATVYLQGGTTTNVTIDGGSLIVSGSAVVTNLYQFGGSVQLAYNSTEATAGFVEGGFLYSERGINALTIGHNGKVDFDPDASVSYTGNSLTMHGGLIRWYDGAIPTITAYKGTIDFSVARRPFTPGSSAFTVGGATIKSSYLVDESNVVKVGQYSGQTETPLP
jgi:hypothetical protein